MKRDRELPTAAIATVADVMAEIHYSHTKLNTMLAEAGAPGDPPDGNCVDKCVRWLKRCNSEDGVDPFEVAGKFIEVFMEREINDGWVPYVKGRERIHNVLAKHGLSYHEGGRVLGGQAGLPSKSLSSVLRSRDFPAVEAEFDRGLKSVETDPAAALTAACAVIESLLKIYIEDEELEPPTVDTIKPLWSIVSRHLGLDPGKIEDDDMRKIGSGLSSVVDGVGAFRTHAGSAHGRGRDQYVVTSQHTRLAIHAAHTLVTFVLEMWT